MTLGFEELDQVYCVETAISMPTDNAIWTLMVMNFYEWGCASTKANYKSSLQKVVSIPENATFSHANLELRIIFVAWGTTRMNYFVMIASIN